ncbi:MAG: hypothetical protein ISS52_03820 [Dehalococcoidia bacterium]|nr:hypothetical protein [Dehalococcoidia bacterium]
MKLADSIRQFAIEQHIALARARGDATIWIRGGDIHSAMELRARLPAVCAALGANKFEQLAGVKRMAMEGPANGANTRFQYRL